jgi:hypothetical protein
LPLATTGLHRAPSTTLRDGHGGMRLNSGGQNEAPLNCCAWAHQGHHLSVGMLDSFWVYTYKVERCPFPGNHVWMSCPYVHRGERTPPRPEPLPVHRRVVHGVRGVQEAAPASRVQRAAHLLARPPLRLRARHLRDVDAPEQVLHRDVQRRRRLPAHYLLLRAPPRAAQARGRRGGATRRLP